MTKHPQEHLCTVMDTVTIRHEGDQVICHVSQFVTGAPGCIEFKMVAEFAVQLSAELQYAAAAALVGLFEDKDQFVKFMDDMANDAADDSIRRHGRFM